MYAFLLVLAFLIGYISPYFSYDIIYNWQTLIAGSLAIVAAFIGGAFISKQIRLSEKHERNRLSREFKAALALFPHSLSYLSTNLLESSHILEKLYRSAIDGGIPTQPNINFPIVSKEVILEISELVKWGDRTLSNVLSELLADLQIAAAQLHYVERALDPNGWTGWTITKHNMVNYLITLAELYSRISLLFPYARRQSKSAKIRVTKKDVQSSLSQMLEASEQIEDLWSTVDLRYPDRKFLESKINEIKFLSENPRGYALVIFKKIFRRY